MVNLKDIIQHNNIDAMQQSIYRADLFAVVFCIWPKVHLKHVTFQYSNPHIVVARPRKVVSYIESEITFNLLTNLILVHSASPSLSLSLSLYLSSTQHIFVILVIFLLQLPLCYRIFTKIVQGDSMVFKKKNSNTAICSINLLI